MNHYSDINLLDGTLRFLAGKEDNERIRAASDIKGHVEAAARELSLERFANFESELYQRIFSFVHDEDLVVKRGGILAIRELIDCTSAAAESKVIKFANTIAAVLKGNTDFSLIELVADALGYMARHSPVSHVDYVESELNRALEWLHGTQPHRLFAACVVLQQLADNAPTIFFVRTREFFDLIWGPLWHFKEFIRLSAAKALSACLAVLSQRTYHLQWYCNIYDMIHEGFHKGTSESIHGSLLVVREMLKHTGNFMMPRFKEVCKAIMLLKDHSSKVVRSAITSLLPSLALFCPVAFARRHLNESVDLLVKCASIPDLRPQALLSTGRLCKALGPHLVGRIDEVILVVQAALLEGSSGKKIRYEVAPEALQCVSDMVLGLGVPFHDRVVSLLEPMLQGGLTAELINTLTVIATHMPYQRPVVQQRLLEESTKLLGGIPKQIIPLPEYMYCWARKGYRSSVSRRKIYGLGEWGAVTQGKDNTNPSAMNSAHPSSAILIPNSGGNGTGLPSVASIGAGLGAAAMKAGSRPYRVASGMFTQHASVVALSSYNVDQRTSPLVMYRKRLPPTALALMQTSTGGAISSVAAHPNPASNISLGTVGGFFSRISTPVASTVAVENAVKFSPEKVLLSLRTIGSLSPPATTLLHLIQENVLPYTNADDISVRKEAAITCAKMFVSSGRPLRLRGPTSLAVEEIISRLLELVVTDPAHSVRLAVLGCLTSDFDLYLRRAQHIETLLFLLSDENFEIKMLTLTILGRLAHLNPAAVLPPLRQLLMRLISEIRGSADDRSKEEAALMMCNFLRASSLHTIVKPFIGTLIRTLPLNADIRLTTASLEAVGELCMVVREEILPYGDLLLPQIISSMYDPSSRRKQEMAVKTLGQLVSATGQVVKPYLQYPQLLPRALDLLFKNAATTPWTLRMQVLRTVGLLGALEPYKYSLIVSHLQNYESQDSERKGSGSDGGLDFKGDISGPAASFLGGSASGVYDYRDRADSNTSSVATSSNVRDAYGDKDREILVGAGLNGKGQRREELIRSEVLLDDDSAEAPAHLFMYEQSVMRSLSEPIVKEEVRRTPSSEDYYPRIAVTALMKILRDSSLSVHHSSVTQAIMLIFKSLGIRCVPFLDQIVPYLLQVARKCGPGLRESLLQQLALLTSIVHHNIAPFLPALFDIIRDYWSEHQEHILILVEELAATATDAFASYIPVVLPLLLSSLSVPRGISAATIDRRDVLAPPLRSLEQTLHCYNSLRGILRPHIHLIVPVICKLISQLQDIGTMTVPWQAKAVATLRRICTSARGAVVEQSLIVVSRTVHCLTRTVNIALEGSVPPQSLIYDECIATLCALGNQMGPRFITFDSLISRSIVGKGLNSGQYRQLSNNLKSGCISEFRYEDLDLGGSFDGEGSYGMGNVRGSESDLVGIGAVHSQWQMTRNDTSALSVGAILHSSPGHALSANTAYFNSANAQNSANASMLHGQQQTGGMQKPLPLNQQQLSRAWDVSQRSTAADWNEWLRRLNVDLLKESPSPALRSCSALAQAYTPLARDLFHAAFVSCWHELSEQYQDSLVRALQTAFRSNTIPPEILQTLLNLAEFMEHDVEALPISLSILAELAQKGHAYAKALHYRELEFQTSPASCFESLININKKLDQYDAAIGVLKVVGQMQKKHPELKETYKVQEAWLAKLGHWGEALRMYDARLLITPRDGMAIAGKLKCLDALGRWEEAIQLCIENLDHLRAEGGPGGSVTHSKAAVIGARAAWSLNGWGLMDNIVSQLPSDNIDASFMRAVIAVHKENYEEAATLIEQTRRHLDGGIRALLAESYGRAYVPLIMVQQCSELEEITEYKMLLREAGMSTPIISMDGQTESNILGGAVRRLSVGGDVSRRNSNASLGQLSQNGSVQSDELAGMNGRGSIARITSSVPRSPRHHGVAYRTQTSTSPTPNGRCGSAGIGCMSPPPGLEPSETTFNPNDANIQALRAEALRRKAHLAEKWRQRIRGCCSSGRAAIPVWKYLLNGRRMVLSEREDLDTWLEFASLCRNGGNTALAERVLNMSQRSASITGGGGLGDETNASMDRRVKFALLKQQWAVSDRKPALNGLDALIRSASNGWESSGRGVNSSSSGSNLAQVDSAVYLDCLLKLGEWKIAMVEPGEVVDRSTRREVLALYGRATLVDPQSYRAWHQWGLSNYRAIEEARGSTGRMQSVGLSSATPRDPSSATKPSPRSDYKLSPRDRKGSITRGQMQPSLVSLSQDVVIPLAVNAAKGLIRAISLGTRKYSSSVAQDMLCLLSVWFRYGKIPEICAAIEAGLATVHLDNWLGVLPQLIARIDHPEQNARRVLHDLLGRLGQRHAQALVYPLSVALKSPKGNRKEAAESLMASLRQHSAKLIDQALLVSQELVRVAILWQEVWHENLEEASRQYFGDGNVQAMLDTLVPLHVTLKEGPSTLREAAFCQAYATDLHEAFEYINAYKQIMSDSGQPIPQSGAAPSARRSNSARTPSRAGTQQNGGNGGVLSREESCLQQAWDLYYAVFKRINAELPQVTMLELHNCSPALLHCRDLDLGVPGTYAVSGSAVRIRNFGPNVAIIRSKQRPRKIKIYGDDGREFVFLLKGHEDLRQDERAMQLFGLVNALLYHNRSTGSESHDLSIQRYAVVPLSPTAGLISWVPNCDTLHDLIRDFRESRKIMLNVEHKLMQQVAPNQTYEALPHPHKLEIFEHALANTAGEDLAKILWLKSETSETWLQRRANYTRSLAVMSMVGYVLGLGDRHPSNLMLDRKSGKVLHIDFGDCFEVAMQREKFPERVPFRLTRMLVNAMEVSGIEGNYRLTCEKVMTVLRENNDSLVATLEAFVHDPLISWRLLNIDRRKDRKGPEGRASTGVKPTKTAATPRTDTTPSAASGPSTGAGGSIVNVKTPLQVAASDSSKPETGESVKTPQGEGGRERAEVKRDLTDTFASCEDPGSSSSKMPSETVKGGLTVETGVRVRPVVPILSFTPFLAQETDSKTLGPESAFPVESGTSPTSIVRPLPAPILPAPPMIPLPQPPAYPSCFVGATRRGSLTRYTQLCNKMEPLIENVLERMDSMGNLLDLDEGDAKKARLASKFKRPLLEEVESDKDEAASLGFGSGSDVRSSADMRRVTESVEHAVEGGVPFSAKKSSMKEIILDEEDVPFNPNSPIGGVFQNKAKIFDYKTGFEEWSTTVVQVEKGGIGMVPVLKVGENGSRSGAVNTPGDKKEKEIQVVDITENAGNGTANGCSVPNASNPSMPLTVNPPSTVKKPAVAPISTAAAVTQSDESKPVDSVVLPPVNVGATSPKAHPRVSLTINTASEECNTNINTSSSTNSDLADVTLKEIERKGVQGDGPVSTSFRPASMGSSMNNGSSFKQLQYQLRQQRHQQQYQIMDPEAPPPPIHGGLSSYRPNLHLEMSSLANSVSLHSPPQTSHSLAHRSVRELSLAQALAGEGGQIIVPEEAEYDESDAQQELLTDKAVTVIRRVMDKLTGLDFYDPTSLAAPTALDVPEQVDRLIIQATANENLCLSFLGWCPFW